MDSIIHSAIDGLILVSGLYGVGKTTLALTAEAPGLTTMLDLDQKSRARAEALGVAYFTPDFEVDPVEVDMEKLLIWFRRVLGELPDGRTHLIIDNGSVLEDAFHVAVQQDPERYGVKRTNATSGKYGGTHPGVGRIWKNLMTYITSNEYKLVTVCVHMSAVWAGGAPIDKYKAKGNKTLTELANLSLVLQRSDKPNTAPRAIVGKEALGLITFQDGEFKVSMALPPVVPECTWKKIGEYIDGAEDKKTFSDDEKPTRLELERYGEWLTTEQKRLIQTIESNPEFEMTEGEAGRIISSNKGSLDSWDDVIKKAIAEKGYSSIDEVREAIRPFHVDGMSFDDAYLKLPTKSVV